MAEILPKNPIGAVPSTIATVFKRIKGIPGDEFRCRWALPLNEGKRPEFLIIYQEKFGFLISVSNTSESIAQELVEPSLCNFLSRPDVTFQSFAEPVEECIDTFSTDQPAISGVVKIILFPNVAQNLLDRIRDQKGGDCTYLGKEALVGTALKARLESLATRAMHPTRIEQLRRAFSPEIAIPRQLVRASGKDRNIAARLTESLLDYDQEHAVKMDLSLSEEGVAAVGSSTVRLITGVAGSGKSLILLHRAALHAKLEPAKSQIILTHNKPLSIDLARRLRLLTKGCQTECTTFLSWCWRILNGVKPVKDHERREIIKRAVVKVPEASGFPIDFLCDEIQWLKDYQKDSLPDYLNASRIGRGRGLNEHQRRAVFRVYQIYQGQLQTQGKEDWAGLPLLVLKRVQEGSIILPRYDQVFVDEAQFFAPVWLKLIQMLVKREGGCLVLAADPTQGFLKRRESWAASGLNVRGRTIKLMRAYRNTRRILEYATEFYRRRLPDDEEEINLPEQERLAELAIGSMPEEVVVSARQDEVTRVCNEIGQYLRGGGQACDILIIVSDGRVEDVVNALNGREGHAVAIDARLGYPGLVRVCSINAATGLESPIVFVMGLSGMMEKEESLGLSPEDRRELIRDNTRKLYMAFTRAMQRLIVVRSSLTVQKTVVAA